MDQPIRHRIAIIEIGKDEWKVRSTIMPNGVAEKHVQVKEGKLFVGVMGTTFADNGNFIRGAFAWSKHEGKLICARRVWVGDEQKGISEAQMMQAAIDLVADHLGLKLHSPQEAKEAQAA